MSHVVCLIADPARAPLCGAAITALERALGSRARWLAADEACEITVDGRGLEEIRACIDATLTPEPPHDVVILPTEWRRKLLLVSDMDSTMITVECIDELADYMGVKEEVSAITRRAMDGEIDFVASLKARVALLEGLPFSVIEEVLQERVRLVAGARTLVQTMRSWGACTALVSGGFAPFVEWVRAAVGFDLAQANRLETMNGRLTGRLLGPVRSPRSKLAVLRQLTHMLRLPRAATLAVGDGANDLPMLRAAGLGVAFRATPPVAALAPVTIKWGDLTALLYLQGVAKEEFVVA